MDQQEQERLRDLHQFEQDIKMQAEAFATFCGEHFKALLRRGFNRHEALELVSLKYESIPNCHDSDDYD